MSNLSDYVDLFNEAKNVDRSTASVLGSMLGVAADFSGTLALAEEIVGVLQTVLFPENNDVLSKIETGLTRLESALKRFLDGQRVEHRLEQLRGLGTFIGPAQRAFEDFAGGLQDPAITEDFKRSQINTCGGILDGLNHIAQFATNFLEERHYEDAWDRAGRGEAVRRRVCLQHEVHSDQLRAGDRLLRRRRPGVRSDLRRQQPQRAAVVSRSAAICL
jgi:hypothetical protein